MKRNDDPAAFRDWMAQVDQELEQICGLGSLDLPDQPYRDQFCDGCSAKAVARRAYRNAGGD